MVPRSKLLAVIAAIVVSGCGATRPPAPPIGAERVLPWGAVVSWPDGPVDSGSLEGRLDSGLASLAQRAAERDSDTPFTYRMLALSGGGARGAFGAGFLTGWSETGTRPRFDVVTGISTGALMATFAFLGPAYDDGLRLYTNVNNADIYTSGTPLRLITAPSILDTTPMRALIAAQITDPVLDAVAREHAAGRRLFVGTTNLETGRFTIWDLGAIASSTRPDRAERYHDVLLAATAFPIMFPPVYIPVEIDGETYWEAHADGATRAAIFARVFMLDVEDLMERANIGPGEVQGELYTLLNTQAPPSTYRDLQPRVASIAERSVSIMLDGVTVYSGDALFRMAMFTGVDFWAAFIPSSIELSESPLEFEPDEMGRLFRIGYEMARSEHPFIIHYPAPENPEGLLKVINPDESFDVDLRAYERAAGLP